ncbi:PRTRC system ThiF family protein [Pedobacter sp. KLB.chiD]|uniref:PRTRC system ThiF family protein n=1 Tax=Pedobacter sp. KLB.chiD TaxID=3387402 RepID=UPI003999DF88
MKIKAHFTATELVTATNPITINVIGAGGTGSKVMTALMEMNHSLLELEHPGLSVRLWDDDVISHANIGRQRFAECEIGLHKSVALINRINRWSGNNWKAEQIRFERDQSDNLPNFASAMITISCVDNVKARFVIADILHQCCLQSYYHDRPRYWMDFGNSQYTGQVILSTVGEIIQPKSERYEPVAQLPFVTEEFGELLKQSEEVDNTPSCSLAEALTKQDLFINSSLVQMGCSLLWNLFRNGMIKYRGFFHNLQNFNTQGIRI